MKNNNGETIHNEKLTLATLAAGMLATGAHAQSSVTLYGSIDEGITDNTNNMGHGTATLGPVAVPDFYGCVAWRIWAAV